MFTVVKGFKKARLKFVLEEIGEKISANVTIAELKDFILKSEQYISDPKFVEKILESAISDRVSSEQYEKAKLKREQFEKERQFEESEKERQFQLELGKVKLNQELELIGQVMLVGTDNCKRIVWPLGKVTEIISGKDKEASLVRVKTSHSTLLRSMQRIYPLKINSNGDITNLLPS
ncbi:hypothetical protein NPIL_420371 [Nephila pilipes]|uniref:DUF5641 domain-containing protein n=1 Tax=Nephila pilipes TaxID=299642 RepID=A0A8X6K2M7_NEPPI|nr:hypothetical protein NPIL_420371 [Nephila pilipes]